MDARGGCAAFGVAGIENGEGFDFPEAETDRLSHNRAVEGSEGRPREGAEIGGATAYGADGTLHVLQWKSGPYSVCMILNPSVMLSTVGISASLNWDKLTIPVLRHCGQRSCSFQWSVIGIAPFWSIV
jgi:hypothetical protein